MNEIVYSEYPSDWGIEIDVNNIENYLYDGLELFGTRLYGYYVGIRWDINFPNFNKVFSEVLKQLGYEDYAGEDDLIYELKEDILRYFDEGDFWHFIIEEQFYPVVEEYDKDLKIYWNLFYDKSFGPPFVGFSAKDLIAIFEVRLDCIEKQVKKLLKDIIEDKEEWNNFIDDFMVGYLNIWNTLDEFLEDSVKEWIRQFENELNTFADFYIDRGIYPEECLYYTKEFEQFLEKFKKAVRDFEKMIASEDFWIEEILARPYLEEKINELVEEYIANKNIEEE